MKVRIQGVYAKHRRLACGTVRTYYYHRATGTALPRDPRAPEFHARVAELNRVGTERRAPDDGRDFVSLIRRYRDSARFASLARRSKQEYDRHLMVIEKAFGRFDVAQVTIEHVSQLRDRFKSTPRKANAIVQVWKILVGYAVEELRWIPARPAGRLRMMPQGDGQRPMEEGEIGEFRKRHVYGTDERLGFEIGLATGLRISDIARVPARQLDEGVIVIRTSKTGETLRAPVTAELRRAWTATVAARSAEGAGPSAWAFPGRDGAAAHPDTLKRRMLEAFRMAGFDAEVRNHAMRYTAAVRLAEAGFSITEVAEFTTHRMATTAFKYIAKKRASARSAAIFDRLDEAYASGM